jgi:hypothetical protein
MKRAKFFASVLILLLGSGVAATTWAGDKPPKDKHGPDLGGLMFAVEGEWLYDPLGLGEPFVNCYTFYEDTDPDDGLVGGVWDDPLFPELGTWVQHSDGGKIRYTAVADDGISLLLSQNGTVKGKGSMKLEAYTTVSILGFGVIAEILTVGHAVDECP